MQGAIAKWGNSLALRLPKGVAEDANLSEGADVDIQVQDGSIIIRAAKKRYNIDDLMNEFKPEHRRPEFDWGRPVGKEII